MASPKIQPFTPIVPMIYAYTTPEIKRHDGWTKIGYTDKQTVQERIKQQTHTADVRAQLEWQDNAMYKDGSGEYFHDTDFHNYLTRQKGVEKQGDAKNEWFRIEPQPARSYFDEFAMRTYTIDTDHYDYTLRPEQQKAVDITKAYFENGGTEFLWNAKPRFGKTLTAYDLVQQMDFKMVLVVTNRPSIANSWADDFIKFVSWRGKYVFVSENDAVSKKQGVVSRNDYLKIRLNTPDSEKPSMIAFESLQGLKGSAYFGGNFDKLKWIADNEFDLLIVDESQEGVDTLKTERAFDNISRKHTLYLSGTPFKALADGRFNADQIFNWSYADEQSAKENWDGDCYNAYESLPRLEMFTYQMSPIIEGKLSQGAAISEDDYADFAFDLNEFFSTDERGVFKYKDSIEKFLDALTTQEKYPFSTPGLRAELPHTLWLLNRVASAKALAKMLKVHPVFKDYEVVVAAGDGRLEDDDSVAEDAFNKVRKAINNYDKTITISVGQLTVGVTVPEWSAVLMLSNMKSPSSYMQAAFRVQNPYETDVIIDGRKQRVQKERAYVFDFDPARTLTVYESFANNLSATTAGGKGTAQDHERNIRRLLNFFPVIGEDEEGKMVEIDAKAVLTIPRRLKSVEVVRHGFMSNYLFSNISNIFSAPSAVTHIIEKLTPADEKSFDAQVNTLEAMGENTVDEYGNVVVPEEYVIGKSKDLFGSKIYEVVQFDTDDAFADIDEQSDTAKIQTKVREVKEALKGSVEYNVVDPAADAYNLKSSKRKQLIKEANRAIDTQAKRIEDDFLQSKRVAEIERDKRIKEAETSYEIEQAETDYNLAVKTALSSLGSAMQEMVDNTSHDQPIEITRKVEEFKAQEEKNSVEDMVRAHLRGFSRTIPSFIMAYGDRNLTLANFDDYTEDDVFEEVTGITEEQFRFLRDGGTYIDEETGEEKFFEGKLFDEVVFNDSIQQFLDKREELANYFDESHTEDIFDYIPPQRTNQIFTPRWVVKKMVDDLEKENPGCFDDSSNTFADLYMKSGLYITEIVKRLYNSSRIKEEIPDNQERIKHILQHQVYGMAPTRIICLIATNYILGFDERLKEETSNFAEADSAEAAKNGTLSGLVEQCFGKEE